MTAPRSDARPKAKDGEPLRFLSNAVMLVMSECIEWPFGKSEGYGMLIYEGRKCGAHELACGAWFEQPPGTEACHTCDNRACVNWRHLYWGTRQDNVDDMMRRRGHWRHQCM